MRFKHSLTVLLLGCFVSTSSMANCDPRVLAKVAPIERSYDADTAKTPSRLKSFLKFAGILALGWSLEGAGFYYMFTMEKPLQTDGSVVSIKPQFESAAMEVTRDIPSEYLHTVLSDPDLTVTKVLEAKIPRISHYTRVVREDGTDTYVPVMRYYARYRVLEPPRVEKTEIRFRYTEWWREHERTVTLTGDQTQLRPGQTFKLLLSPKDREIIDITE